MLSLTNNALYDENYFTNFLIFFVLDFYALCLFLGGYVLSCSMNVIQAANVYLHPDGALNTCWLQERVLIPAVTPIALRKQGDQALGSVNTNKILSVQNEQ